MASHFYWLVVGILAVWRITHLFYGEDGPGDIFVRLRRAAGQGFWGSLLDCFYCLSVWIAIPFACWLGDSWKQRLMLWPALSAGAILLERLTKGEPAQPPVFYTEDKETDRVLRQGQTTTEDHELRSPAK